MNNFYVNNLIGLCNQTKDSDSLPLIKENLTNFCRYLFEDVQLNQYKNIKENIKTIKDISENLLKTNDKDIKIAVIEFLVNVTLILKEQIMNYFNDFFEIIVENYDDFEAGIKLSVDFLNNHLQDVVVSSISKANRQISRITLKISSYLPTCENERVRIMLLKWIYLIDSFPCCEVKTDLELVIGHLISAYTDRNVRIREIASTKTRQLIDKYRYSFMDLKNLSELLRVIQKTCKELRPTDRNQFDELVFSVYSQVLNLLRQIIEKDTQLNIKNDLWKKVFNIVIQEIYLMQLKKSSNTSSARKIGKQIKIIIDSMAERAEDKDHLKEQLESLLGAYKQFIIETNCTNFGIIYEINDLIKNFLNRNLVYYDMYIDNLVQMFHQLMLNKRLDYSNKKFKHFLTFKLKEYFESIFKNKEQIMTDFLLLLFNKLFSEMPSGLLDRIFFELLYVFRPRLDLLNIIFLFTKKRNLYVNAEQLFEFLFIEIPKENDKKKEEISAFFYTSCDGPFKEEIYSSPLWFILFNCVLKNFKTCVKSLDFLVNHTFETKSLRHQVALVARFDLMAGYLTSLAKSESYNLHPDFLHFISKVCLLISQGKDFHQLLRLLKFKKGINVNPRFNSSVMGSDLECYFESFRDYLLQANPSENECHLFNDQE